MNSIILLIILILMGLATLFAVIRIIAGPTVPDRAVGLDTATTVTTSFMVLLALLLKRGIFLDVSLVYAILGFLGVIAIARYLEGGL